MSDERSERLRRNRNRAKERVQHSAEADESSKPDEPSQLDNQSDTDDQSEPSVKDERVGTYMYLPERQQRELSRLYNVLKAEYEYEFDAEFEKNRHFYPLVVEFGKQRLDGLDASDIQEKLERLDSASDAE